MAQKRLYLRDLGRYIRHALGISPEQAIADELSVVAIVNHAGEWLVNAHQWLWLDVATISLNKNSGQNYVTLPADFRSMTNLMSTDGLNQEVVLTTMGTILEYRTQDITTTTFTTWAALSYRRLSTGQPTPVLEIYPTPTASQTGVMTMYYTAGWLPVSDDGDAVIMPTWMEPLFIQIVREYALGYEEDGNVGLLPRLEQLRQSSMWMDACARDGEVQWNVGQPLGGAAQSMGSMSPFDYPRRINNP